MSEIIKCPTCKTEFEAAIDNCDSCGFPFAGTDKEKSVFIGQQIMKKGKISETKKSINQTRIVLFVIAAFYIIVPFLQYSNVQSATVLIALNVIVGLVFFNLWCNIEDTTIHLYFDPTSHSDWILYPCCNY